MSAPVQDFETGLYLEGDQWLADWKPDMTYDEWEASRAKAGEILTPKPTTETMSLAQRLTMKART